MEMYDFDKSFILAVKFSFSISWFNQNTNKELFLIYQ